METIMSREEDIKQIKKHGFKNFKPERHSYKDENGQKWLQCKFCCEYQKVDEPIGAITCSSCLIKIDMIKYPESFKQKQYKPTGRPPGWHWMAEYVDKDGNVFHKGKEQPKLKGTLKPTKVKPIKKRKKLTADEKLYKRIGDWKKRKKARKKKK
tara:strand:- start:1426 stop:1887 length:462 start_codon:yes stop_codon:yes gene_type:complete